MAGLVLSSRVMARARVRLPAVKRRFPPGPRPPAPMKRGSVNRHHSSVSSSHVHHLCGVHVKVPRGKRRVSMPSASEIEHSVPPARRFRCRMTCDVFRRRCRPATAQAALLTLTSRAPTSPPPADRPPGSGVRTIGSGRLCQVRMPCNASTPSPPTHPSPRCARSPPRDTPSTRPAGQQPSMRRRTTRPGTRSAPASACLTATPAPASFTTPCADKHRSPNRRPFP